MSRMSRLTTITNAGGRARQVSRLRPPIHLLTWTREGTLHFNNRFEGEEFAQLINAAERKRPTGGGRNGAPLPNATSYATSTLRCRIANVTQCRMVE